MSETTAEYRATDENDIQKHIEQECIFGSFNRLRPIIEAASKKSRGRNPSERRPS